MITDFYLVTFQYQIKIICYWFLFRKQLSANWSNLRCSSFFGKYKISSAYRLYKTGLNSAGHISTHLFSWANGEPIATTYWNARKCKILKFGEDSSRRNNPDKVFYNLSSDTLSKRLNFALPTTSLEYSDYLVDYQSFLETHLLLKAPTSIVSYWRVDLRTLLFRISRLIIHSGRLPISHWRIWISFIRVTLIFYW